MIVLTGMDYALIGLLLVGFTMLIWTIIQERKEKGGAENE